MKVVQILFLHFLILLTTNQSQSNIEIKNQPYPLSFVNIEMDKIGEFVVASNISRGPNVEFFITQEISPRAQEKPTKKRTRKRDPIIRNNTGERNLQPTNTVKLSSDRRTITPNREKNSDGNNEKSNREDNLVRTGTGLYFDRNLNKNQIQSREGRGDDNSRIYRENGTRRKSINWNRLPKHSITDKYDDKIDIQPAVLTCSTRRLYKVYEYEMRITLIVKEEFGLYENPFGILLTLPNGNTRELILNTNPNVLFTGYFHEFTVKFRTTSPSGWANCRFAEYSPSPYLFLPIEDRSIFSYMNVYMDAGF
ncbi:MAG: hypothetical protein K9J12_11195 [Melioribacteraceae bacterium]|nr:hypothetical protein [Melioribacteraceae bacterium]MCF8264461.1 hypothetical protein [Melioribacteraceae bacterium]